MRVLVYLLIYLWNHLQIPWDSTLAKSATLINQRLHPPTTTTATTTYTVASQAVATNLVRRFRPFRCLEKPEQVAPSARVLGAAGEVGIFGISTCLLPTQSAS